MTSAYSINLNFNNTIPVKTDFTFKQGDKGITLNLATTGLDPTGTTAHIVFKRSNGTSVEAELTGQTGPNYSYTILGNEFEIPGVVVADLKLYNGDTQRVSTASFIFMVTGDTMDGVGGGTGGYSDQLEQLSEEFEDTLNEYKDAFGDVGAIKPRGAYSSSADYNVLDLVSYNGSSYLCRTACKNKVPTNTTYWQVFASGGGGGTSDYDDLTDKPSINSVTLSGNKTTEDLGLFSGDYDDLTNKPTLFSGDYSDLTNKPTIPSNFDDLADVDMAGVTNGQVPAYNSSTGKYEPVTPSGGGGGGTNPNLLINPWFTVNQRGFTSGTANDYTNKYFVDRWLMSFGTGAGLGTFSKTTSGIHFAPSGGALRTVQKPEDLTIFNGRTLTFSVLYAEENSSNYKIESGTVVTFDSSADAQFFSNSYITVAFKTQYNGFVIYTNLECTIKAVKLEIGSTSTLHLDTAPDYTTELLKCQRYYYRIQALANYAYIATCVAVSNAQADGFLKLPTPMRATPTASISGTVKLYNGSLISLSSNLICVIRIADLLYLAAPATVTSGNAYSLCLVSSGDYIELDAEL